ncbi:hypothetical protein [Rhizobium sp.]|uniref:hypothetical protein n=1 Tax=Rhizobium sp. TaxID=391 RepID=UPI002F0A4041
MQMTKLRSRILAATLTGLVALGATSSAHAYSIYRGVNANAGTGIVDWTLASFGVSAGPAPVPPNPPHLPTLSFFHYADDAAARIGRPAAQCFVKVDLGNLINPALNTQLPIGNVNIPINVTGTYNPRAFPWNITFDNDPADHWSIAKTQIQSPITTNGEASRVAAGAFQSLATAAGSGVTVINGTLGNCTAQ